MIGSEDVYQQRKNISSGHVGALQLYLLSIFLRSVKLRVLRRRRKI